MIVLRLSSDQHGNTETSLERLRWVHPHPLKFGNECATSVLRTVTFDANFLFKAECLNFTNFALNSANYKCKDAQDHKNRERQAFKREKLL